MKIAAQLASLVILLSSVNAQAAKSPPHLDPEMTSHEYQTLLKTRRNSVTPESLSPILKAGERLLKWIDQINETRAPDQQLQLSTPESQGGYPIDRPSIYSRELLLKEWKELKPLLPEIMQKVLVDGADAVTELPIDDKAFIAAARKVDKSYQFASRWLLVEPHLSHYERIAGEDVRGYHFLTQDAQLEEHLKAWPTLEIGIKQRYTGWLIGECRNAKLSESRCKRLLRQAVERDGHPWAMHQEHVQAAKAHWESFFTLSASRDDVT